MFKVKKSKTYITITSYHLKDINLSIEAKGLQSWLLSDFSNWDGTFEEIISLNSTLTRSQLINILNELQEKGYLEIDKNNNYIIYDKPVNVKDKVFKPITLESDANSSETGKKKNLYQKCDEAVRSYTQDEKLYNALIQYLKLRLNPGAGTRLASMPLQYFNQWRNQLFSLDTMKGDKVKIVEQSIMKGWAKFVDLPETVSLDKVKSNSYTMEEIEEFKNRAKKLEEEGGKGIF